MRTRKLLGSLVYDTLFVAHRDEVVGFRSLPTRGLHYLRNVTLR